MWYNFLELFFECIAIESIYHEGRLSCNIVYLLGLWNFTFVLKNSGYLAPTNYTNKEFNNSWTWRPCWPSPLARGIRRIRYCEFNRNYFLEGFHLLFYLPRKWYFPGRIPINRENHRLDCHTQIRQDFIPLRICRFILWGMMAEGNCESRKCTHIHTITLIYIAGEVDIQIRNF